MIEFNKFCKIEKAFVSDEFLYSSVYDIISTDPTINQEEVKYTETYLIGEDRFTNIISHDSNIINNNYISYIKFIVNTSNETEVVSLIHNNYKHIKLWINYKFICSSDNWYTKLITKLTKGNNTFLIEVYDLKRHRDFLISLYDINYKIPSYEYVDFSDTIDIRENYIVTNRIIDSEGFIRFSIRTNNHNYEDKIKVFLAVQDFRNKYETKLINLKEIYVHINEINCINVKEKLYLYNITEDLDCLKIILYVSPKEVDDVRYIKDYESVGFYFSFNERIVTNLDTEINRMMNDVKYSWQEELIDYELSAIRNRNLRPNIKFYLLEQLHHRIKHIINFSTYIEYLQSSGYKEVFYRSIIDEQVYRFSISVPSEKKTSPLMMILASESNNAYIPYFIKMFREEYIIIECSTRGKHFGNYIAESAVLEVYNMIKDSLNIDRDKIFLFGHSSSGAVASSLISKYPDEFAGCFVVSSMWNKRYIKNASHKRIISICGELDENIKKHYIEKEDFFSKSFNLVNILIPIANDCIIATFLRNQELINTFVSSYTEDKSNSYMIDNMYYNKYKNLKIIEKKDPLQNALIKYEENKDLIKVCLENVKKIEIIPISYPIDIEDVTSNKTYSLEANQTKVLDLENEGSQSISLDLLEALNKLEILNIYHYSLIGIHSSENNIDEINILSKLCNPKLLAVSAKVNVQYPLKQIQDNFINKLTESNYAIVNYPIDQYVSKFENKIYSILCYEDGFGYKGQKYLGDYSIIQVLPNLLHKNNFIAFINYNNPKTLSRNFFLRNIVLVTDDSVDASVYRNVAIIYYNNKYLCIKKYGMDLEKLLV